MLKRQDDSRVQREVLEAQSGEADTGKGDYTKVLSQKFPPKKIKEASESFQTLCGTSWIVTKSEVTT